METAIEEQAIRAQDGGDYGDDIPGQGKDAVDSILAKRGLASPSMDEEEDGDYAEALAKDQDEGGQGGDSAAKEFVDNNNDDDDDDDGNDDKEAILETPESPEQEGLMQDLTEVNLEGGENALEQQPTTPTEDMEPPPAPKEQDTIDATDSKEHGATVAVEEQNEESVNLEKGSATKEESLQQKEPVAADSDSNKPPTTTTTVEKSKPTAAATTTTTTTTTTTASLNSALQSDYKAALLEVRDAQREARTLRRHVVALNAELEKAEAEIQAQRSELERAGERLEKDRKRHKEEKEKLTRTHTEETKTLQRKHDTILQDTKTKADQQLADAWERLRQAEDKRLQEGGDWTKELEEALHREQDALRRAALVE